MFAIAYFSYHGTVRQLMKDGKLACWYYAKKHNRISPALVLVFDDAAHPVMPIREYRWPEYLPFLPAEKEKPPE